MPQIEKIIKIVAHNRIMNAINGGEEQWKKFLHTAGHELSAEGADAAGVLNDRPFSLTKVSSVYDSYKINSNSLAKDYSGEYDGYSGNTEKTVSELKI